MSQYLTNLFVKKESVSKKPLRSTVKKMPLKLEEHTTKLSLTIDESVT